MHINPWGYPSPKVVNESDDGQAFGGFPTYEVTRAVGDTRHVVDKRTHRIRFENETESQVIIVIEPKDSLA